MGAGASERQPTTPPRAGGVPPIADAGERWRNTLAELEYAERHGAHETEVEELADRVIEARVAMFQSGVQSGWALPAFLRSALDRDRELLEVATASRLRSSGGAQE